MRKLLSIVGISKLMKTVENINTSTDNMVNISKNADQTLTYLTKVTGVSIGIVGTAKETLDILEVVTCAVKVDETVSMQ